MDLYTLILPIVTSCVAVQLLSHTWLFCDPKDCSPPSFSVHGIFQVSILEWVAISAFRGSSWPRDWTQVSCVFCIAGRFFRAEPLISASENTCSVVSDGSISEEQKYTYELFFRWMTTATSISKAELTQGHAVSDSGKMQMLETITPAMGGVRTSASQRTRGPYLLPTSGGVSWLTQPSAFVSPRTFTKRSTKGRTSAGEKGFKTDGLKCKKE